MVISDLNYMEVASASVEGGISFGNGYNWEVSYGNFTEYLNIHKNLTSYVAVYGHAATAESTAGALGYGTATQIFTSTLTTPTSSASTGTSISFSN